MNQTPSHHCSALILPTLKNQERLHLYDRKSATNLATICWDIVSFFCLSAWSFMKEASSPHMCMHLLLCVLIVLKSILSLCGCWQCATSAVCLVSGGLWFRGGCASIDDTDLHFHPCLVQHLNVSTMLCRLVPYLCLLVLLVQLITL